MIGTCCDTCQDFVRVPVRSEEHRCRKSRPSWTASYGYTAGTDRTVTDTTRGAKTSVILKPARFLPQKWRCSVFKIDSVRVYRTSARLLLDEVHVRVEDLATTDSAQLLFLYPHHKENLITVNSVINGFSFDNLKPSAFTTGFTFNNRNNKKMKKNNISAIVTVER